MSKTPGVRAPAVIVVALLVAGLVNIGQFREIDAQAPGVHWRALYQFQSGDIAEIAVSPESPTNVRERFGLSFALREHAPGATLVVPSDQGLSRTIARENLVGLGAVHAIERADYVPNEQPEVAGTLVAEADNADEEPFRLILLDGDVERLVLFRPSGTFIVVDERLLPPSHEARSSS